MLNNRDILFLSVFSGASAIGNALGNSTVASLRNISINESAMLTSVGVAVTTSAFTFFKAAAGKHSSDVYLPPILHLGGVLLGAVGWNLLLNTATSSETVCDPVINSILGYPITFGTVFLFLNIFILIEKCIDNVCAQALINTGSERKMS